MELELSTPIQEFYKGSVIFITGSTGFLGQVLLEKLLRSCPQISTFYILVRKKKGKDMASRVTEMLDCVIFKELIKQNPDLRHKIVGLPGDCSLENLGLSMEDRQLLVQKVINSLYIKSSAYKISIDTLGYLQIEVSSF